MYSNFVISYCLGKPLKRFQDINKIGNVRHTANICIGAVIGAIKKDEYHLAEDVGAAAELAGGVVTTPAVNFN